MSKGYQLEVRDADNHQESKLKSICGDNIKYPRTKSAYHQETYGMHDSLRLQ